MDNQIKDVLKKSAKYFGLHQPSNVIQANNTAVLSVSENRNSFLNKNLQIDLAARSHGLGHEAEFKDSQQFLNNLEKLSSPKDSMSQSKTRSAGFFKATPSKAPSNIIDFPIQHPRMGGPK